MPQLVAGDLLSSKADRQLEPTVINMPGRVDDCIGSPVSYRVSIKAPSSMAPA